MSCAGDTRPVNASWRSLVRSPSPLASSTTFALRILQFPAPPICWKGRIHQSRHSNTILSLPPLARRAPAAFRTRQLPSLLRLKVVPLLRHHPQQPRQALHLHPRQSLPRLFRMAAGPLRCRHPPLQQAPLLPVLLLVLKLLRKTLPVPPQPMFVLTV